MEIHCLACLAIQIGRMERAPKNGMVIHLSNYGILSCWTRDPEYWPWWICFFILGPHTGGILHERIWTWDSTSAPVKMEKSKRDALLPTSNLVHHLAEINPSKKAGFLPHPLLVQICPNGFVWNFWAKSKTHCSHPTVATNWVWSPIFGRIQMI